MPRGVKNVPAEEPVVETPAEPEAEVPAEPVVVDENAPADETPAEETAEEVPSEVVEGDEELEIQPEVTTGEDPDLDDDTDDDSDEDDEDTAAEPEGEGVVVTYNGLKEAGKTPVFVTINVPEDGTEPDDPTASISDGLTLTLKLGTPARVPAEAAAWLRRHPTYDIS